MMPEMVTPLGVALPKKVVLRVLLVRGLISVRRSPLVKPPVAEGTGRRRVERVAAEAAEPV